MTNLLFGFNGRIGRQTYVVTLIASYLVFALAIVYIVPLAFGLVLPRNEKWVEQVWLAQRMLPLIIFAWVLFALTAKRLHDFNRTGWWAFPPLNGIVVPFVAPWVRGDEAANRYGSPPTKIFSVGHLDAAAASK